MKPVRQTERGVRVLSFHCFHHPMTDFKIMTRLCIVGLELQCSDEFICRLIEAVLLSICDSKIIVGLRRIRLKLQCSSQFIRCIIKAVLM